VIVAHSHPCLFSPGTGGTRNDQHGGRDMHTRFGIIAFTIFIVGILVVLAIAHYTG
jgi:hypothetical protein